MIEWFKGKKTYLAMIVLGILGISWSQGWVDDKTAEVIGSILAPVAGITMRMAIGSKRK